MVPWPARLNNTLPSPTMKHTSPRNSAGSFELKEGIGAITTMCSCGEFLEIYKIDKTFRVTTPESIDPKETNPNAPWVVSPVSDVGSANPIVARVLLQGHEILKAAAIDGDVDIDAVTKQLHSCKEILLGCERMAESVGDHIDHIIADITERGIARDNHGRGLNPFPQVPNLDADCGSFLVQANRAIKLICELPPHFISLERIDSNFDYLAKRLASAIGGDTPLVQFLTANAPSVRYLIHLRNFHEHPKDVRTIIKNFHIMPSGEVAAPTWQLSGTENSEPRPVKEEMFAAIGFLVQLAEAMLIHLVLYRISRQFPYIVEEIPDEDVDDKLPIKFRLSIDITKLHMSP